jgi:hypothetical protein
MAMLLFSRTTLARRSSLASYETTLKLFDPCLAEREGLPLLSGGTGATEEPVTLVAAIRTGYAEES